MDNVINETGLQIIEFWNWLFFSIRQIDNESTRDQNKSRVITYRATNSLQEEEQ